MMLLDMTWNLTCRTSALSHTIEFLESLSISLGHFGVGISSHLPVWCEALVFWPRLWSAPATDFTSAQTESVQSSPVFRLSCPFPCSFLVHFASDGWSCFKSWYTCSITSYFRSRVAKLSRQGRARAWQREWLIFWTTLPSFLAADRLVFTRVSVVPWSQCSVRPVPVQQGQTIRLFTLWH